MSATKIWAELDIKIIAILRGVQPSETASIVEALISSGIHAIEIPLNSPTPFESIENAVRAAETVSDIPCLIGAGTVLEVPDVRRIKDVGGNLVVSPNVEKAIIEEAVTTQMFSAPGVFTPSECIRAIDAGAHCLKVFPANIMGPGGIKALSAVFGQRTELCAVGGIGHPDFKDYLTAGCSAFGLGSLLYRPGMSASEVGQLAAECVASFRNAKHSI